MDNGEDCTLEISKCFLKARTRGNIQMVDGLIEQEEYTPLCNEQRKLQAGAFAERKFSCRTKRIVAFEEEVMQEITCFCLVEGCHTLNGLQRIEAWIEQFLFL